MIQKKISLNKEQLEEFEQLAGAYGYAPPVKETVNMRSYINADSEDRINYYYTTGTVTIQKNGTILTVKDINTLGDFEKVLLDITKKIYG